MKWIIWNRDVIMRCAKRGPGAFFSCAGIFMRLEDILPFLPPGLLPDSLYYFYICCVSVVRAAIACLYSWKAAKLHFHWFPLQLESQRSYFHLWTQWSRVCRRTITRPILASAKGLKVAALPCHHFTYHLQFDQTKFTTRLWVVMN